MPEIVIPGRFGDNLLGRLAQVKLSKGRLSQESWTCSVALETCELWCAAWGDDGASQSVMTVSGGRAGPGKLGPCG